MRLSNNYKKYVLNLIFVLICYLANAQFQYISSPFIKNYTTKDYSGQPDNFAGIEDDRGLMFFGNLWGILEFDGVNWRNIYFPNGSSGVSFAKDEKGVIYCGGRGEFGFLAPDSLGYLQYISLIHFINKEINFSDVWSTFYTDSSIVFCSYEALFILKQNHITVVQPKTIFERAYLVHGKIYVREKGRGLCCLINNKLELVQGGEFFANRKVSGILPFKKGKLLIVDNNSFYQFDNGNISKHWNVATINNLNNATPLNDSCYVLATNPNGLIIMDDKGRICNIFNKRNGLISNDVLNAFADSNGNIWVLTRGGISKIEMNGCFGYIDYSHGVTGIIYTTILFNEAIYVGTSEGLFSTKFITHANDGLVNPQFEKEPGIQGTVWSLCQFNGELFCGHDKGVFVINDQKTYNISGINGAWCFLQPQGYKKVILVGTYNGIIILEKQGQVWKLRGQVKGFYESSRYLVQDKLEEFWVSHGNKGLYKLMLSHNLDSVLRIKLYGIPDGINSDYNNTVYSYNNEVIVTNNKGFYKYNYKTDHYDTWPVLNRAIGDFSAIQRFVTESDTSFWLVLNDEKIVHVIKNDSNNFKTDITIKKFNKLLAGSFEYILPLSENKTLIATLNGVAVFDKGKYESYIQRQGKHFKAYIRSAETTKGTFVTIDAGDKSIYEKDPSFIPELNYKRNSIQFSFSSNCFEDIELIRYRFFLEGFDESWSPWLITNKKEYTNLSPGNYKFRVQALDSYNITSKEAFFEFIILPPRYGSTYAYLAYLTALSLFLYGIYKFTIYRFKIQRKRLELKNEREMWYLNKKHNEERIKRENEILKLNNEKLAAEITSFEQQELIQKRQQQLREEQMNHEKEKHLFEIDYKNKELSMLIIQMTHKSELISKIREFLLNYIKKDNSPKVKMVADHLLGFIDKDDQQDEEWKKFQEHFDMVHTRFLQRLKTAYPEISRTLLKLSACLRIKMNNKQIARLMNITVESVLKNRYRLREKLNLSSDENLNDFIEGF